jgi:hypothetical protein
MRWSFIISVLLALAALGVAGCGKSEQMRHGFLAPPNAVVAVHPPCFDVNGDQTVTLADANRPLAGGAEAPSADVPDFNADGRHDERDAPFLDAGVHVDPAARESCGGDAPVEFMVGAPAVPAIDCAKGDAVLVAGAAGGIADMRSSEDGAGVRWMMRGLMDRLREGGAQTLGVVAGPAVPGFGASLQGGAEQWLTHAVATYLDQYPCARAVLLGHSHGAVTMDVVAARLEGRYGDRIALVARIDRIEDLYFGDTQSMPATAPVLNVYETGDGKTHSKPYDGANIENVDVTSESAPEHGEEGGRLRPINHSTIDNSRAVRDLIIDRALRELGLSG